MQEPSAQLPAALLDVKPGERVLDLCAAPGGKSGQLAASLHAGLFRPDDDPNAAKSFLVANEPVPERASVLAGTLERLGAVRTLITCMQPEPLCRKFSGFFDAVLVDAPCSGEGMFRREPAAVQDWSVAHVRACAARQAAILDAADLALRPGGRLMYSTCTFSPEEDEDTVYAFLERHPGYVCRDMRRLYPHTSPGEGQFMALLQKCSDAELKSPVFGCGMLRPDHCPVYDAFAEQFLVSAPKLPLRQLPDGRILLLPESLPADLAGLRIVRAGLSAGELRNGRFFPAHGLFLALSPDAFRQTVPLSGTELAAFLAGETVSCEAALSGWCAVTVAGFPLGFGKAVAGTLKNHIPKGLRILLQHSSKSSE